MAGNILLYRPAEPKGTKLIKWNLETREQKEFPENGVLRILVRGSESGRKIHPGFFVQDFLDLPASEGRDLRTDPPERNGRNVPDNRKK